MSIDKKDKLVVQSLEKKYQKITFEWSDDILIYFTIHVTDICWICFQIIGYNYNIRFVYNKHFDD